MIHFRPAILSALAWTVAISHTHAEHSGRPNNLPPIGLTMYFIRDGDGTIRAIESFGAPGPDLFVYGWSYDQANPDSPFEPSSPNYSLSSTKVFSGFSDLAYNGSKITYNELNLTSLSSDFGPDRISMFDSSQLVVTNSNIQAVTAKDTSNVTLRNTQARGEIQMQSTGVMVLDSVTPFQTPFVSPSLFLVAAGGLSNISSSTLSGVTLRNFSNATVSNSNISSDLTLDGFFSGGFPTATLTNTTVGKVSVNGGRATMSGGQVNGVVQVSNDGGAAGGSIASFDDVHLKGDVIVSSAGQVTINGGLVEGSLRSTGGNGVIRASSTDIRGGILALGSTEITVSNSPSVGLVNAFNNSKVTIAAVEAIKGDVYAKDNSTIEVNGVKAIEGAVFLEGNVKLDLDGTSTFYLSAIENSTINIRGGSTGNVEVDNGTVNLSGTPVAGRINVGGKGHVSFGPGSSTGDSIVNFGNEMGFVSVSGGIIGADLGCYGNSITAMSGGHVKGHLLLSEQATFLYSGGTFGFDEPAAGASGETFLKLGGGEFAAAAPMSSGFKIVDDAQIQFIGFGLQSTLVNPNFMSDDGISFSIYQLTGRLADNTNIDGGMVYVQNAVTAHFELLEAPVPEPSTAGFIALALLAWVGFRRPAAA